MELGKGREGQDTDTTLISTYINWCCPRMKLWFIFIYVKVYLEFSAGKDWIFVGPWLKKIAFLICWGQGSLSKMPTMLPFKVVTQSGWQQMHTEGWILIKAKRGCQAQCQRKLLSFSCTEWELDWMDQEKVTSRSARNRLEANGKEGSRKVK